MLEDLENLTKVVEDSKQQNAKLLVDRTAGHQLRMAALDKRLQAHQDAFVWWRKLMRTAHDENAIGTVVMDAQEWREQNCLYLEANVRAGFTDSFIAAGGHKKMLIGAAGGPRSKELADSLSANWMLVVNAGAIIAAAVELPRLAGERLEPVEIT